MNSNEFLFLYTILALLILGTGGNLACKVLFKLTGLAGPQSSSTSPKAGRVIGWLERLLIALGIISASWEVFAAVIALKTVSRFKDLDDQIPAEYFLVGSLFSLVWAATITCTWLYVDRTYGRDVSHHFRALADTESASGNIENAECIDQPRSTAPDSAGGRGSVRH